MSGDLEARIVAIFDRARAELDRARDDALALVVKATAKPDWLSLEAAAALRGVTRETMARHAKQFGLGTFTGRRWRIDPDRLKALNEGRLVEPFDTTNCGVENCQIPAKPDDSPDAAGDLVRADSAP